MDAFVNELCMFTSALRLSFSQSDATAKAKVTEHWYERLPLVIVFSVCSVFIKSAIEFTSETNLRACVDVSTHAVMCALAVFLVYLRVPQAIFSDAKKAASEVYIEHKTRLYQRLLCSAELV
jgi:uncharacterized membrane protein YobD (UPF0266 family)